MPFKIVVLNRGTRAQKGNSGSCKGGLKMIGNYLKQWNTWTFVCIAFKIYKLIYIQNEIRMSHETFGLHILCFKWIVAHYWMLQSQNQSNYSTDINMLELNIAVFPAVSHRNSTLFCIILIRNSCSCVRSLHSVSNMDTVFISIQMAFVRIQVLLYAFELLPQEVVSPLPCILPYDWLV